MKSPLRNVFVTIMKKRSIFYSISVAFHCDFLFLREALALSSSYLTITLNWLHVDDGIVKKLIAGRNEKAVSLF